MCVVCCAECAEKNIEDSIFGHAVCFYFLVLLLIELFSEKWV